MSETIAVFPTPRPLIRRVPVDRPWIWLAAGWRDIVAAPAASLSYGLVPVAAGWLAIVLMLRFDLPYLVLPLSAGFFYVGPFIATGLYEISRRLEAGQPVDGKSTLMAWRRNPEQIALMGVLLLLFHLAWMRMAQLLFAIFEWRSVPSWDRFLDLVWTSSKSLPFLALGVGLGAVLAAPAVPRSPPRPSRSAPSPVPISWTGGTRTCSRRSRPRWRRPVSISGRCSCGPA